MSESDENLFKYIISGRFNKLPDEKSNFVRIFFSSTFSGTNMFCFK